MRLVRRDFLAGAGVFLVARGAVAETIHPIAEIEGGLGGRIGFSAIDTGNGRRLQHRGGERFAMCSTFKATLAAAILARVDHGELKLDEKVVLPAANLLANSPMTSAHIADGTLTLEALCRAAVEVSDNTAANYLLSLIGGPPGLTAFFRQTGDRVSRLDRIELELNSNYPGDPRDTTTPEAMAGTLSSIVLGQKILSDISRECLTGWMLNEQNGRDRIRSAVPASWRVANKPGTSAESAGETNDIAVIWPPGRKPIVLCIYIDARNATFKRRVAAIGDVTRLIVSAFT